MVSVTYTIPVVQIRQLQNSRLSLLVSLKLENELRIHVARSRYIIQSWTKPSAAHRDSIWNLSKEII